MGGSTNKSSATFYTLLLPSKHYQLMSKIKYLLHGKKRAFIYKCVTNLKDVIRQQIFGLCYTNDDKI